jgi:hypothetical protein
VRETGKRVLQYLIPGEWMTTHQVFRAYAGPVSSGAERRAVRQHVFNVLTEAADTGRVERRVETRGPHTVHLWRVQSEDSEARAA